MCGACHKALGSDAIRSGRRRRETGERREPGQAQGSGKGDGIGDGIGRREKEGASEEVG